jgi:hypothetical protein
MKGIILESYDLPERYFKNNKECFLDPVRKRMIQITPEEIIRQQTVSFLVNELQVPINKIELEVPMSYFVKGSKGRADIIVYGKENDVLVPILIVECKAPNVEITDKVINQVVKYDEMIYADTLMITNGIEILFMTWEEKENGYMQLKAFPTYEELNEKFSLPIDTTPYMPWKRPDFVEHNIPAVRELFESYGWIGEDSSSELCSFFINLAGFIQDENTILSSQNLNGIGMIADKGIRFTTFGNAAGGDWAGLYRYFIINDDNKNNQIISLSVLAKGKFKNHPVFGNSKGHTILIVAIDDYDKSHNSLQLDLDRFTIKHDDYFVIWHNGALTNGKKGAVKQNEVIRFVQEKAPELIDENGRVFLGAFDNRKEITWNQKQTKQFISRLIKYSLLRDEFRRLNN